MGDRAKAHHLVSKFYLRHFADEAEQVMTVILPGEKPPFRQSIQKASVHTNFYTALDLDGQPTDVAEQAFNEIERVAAGAWRQVVAGVWPLPQDARENMAGWIALHLLRGSATRTRMSQGAAHMLTLDVIVGGRPRIRQMLQDAGEPHDDESVTREWIAMFTDPLIVEASANHHLHYIAEALPEVTATLLNRWWLLTTFQRKGLATSDHPVHVVSNTKHQAIGLGTGIVNADVIHVPLTRRHSLALALRSTLPPELATQRVDGHYPGVTATALYSNWSTVNSARRMLFHHPADAPLKGIDLPQPRAQEIEHVGDPWRLMADEDRQILHDAGLRSRPEEDDSRDHQTERGSDRSAKV